MISDRDLTSEEIENTWNTEQVSSDLDIAFKQDSEIHLLSILKNNSFLFYELFTRKGGALPVFHEVSFGTGLRCDFTWLNDNSDGPEWGLLEVEKPRLELFTNKNEPNI